MTDYKLKTIIECTITIEDTLQRELPSLNVPLRIIKYKISNDEVEIELHRIATYGTGFWPGSLFGRESKKGVYTLRSYGQEKTQVIHRDIEITGEELRDNMNSLIRKAKECWASGDHCPTHLDHSQNFWANGDLQLLELILEKDLPMSVRDMLLDLKGSKSYEVKNVH